MPTLCPVIINPGYEAPEARVHASRVTSEAGVCLGKTRFGYGSALGEGISRDPIEEAWFELSRNYVGPNGTGDRKQSRDFIKEADGSNLYCYVKNSPINQKDFLGLEPGDDQSMQAMKGLFDILKGVWKAQKDGTLCPTDPCKIQIISLPALLCTCLENSEGNFEKIAACICVGDSENYMSCTFNVITYLKKLTGNDKSF